MCFCLPLHSLQISKMHKRASKFQNKFRSKTPKRLLGRGQYLSNPTPHATPHGLFTYLIITFAPLPTPSKIPHSHSRANYSEQYLITFPCIGSQQQHIYIHIYILYIDKRQFITAWLYQVQHCKCLTHPQTTRHSRYWFVC